MAVIFLADVWQGGGVRLELAGFDYEQAITRGELVSEYADIASLGQ